MYIAEQQLLAAAVGISRRGWNPFASTFAAFFSRAYDFIRMAAISRANLRLAGSHAGVSIGEDGPSQMALEDIASLRAIHSSIVLQPCDANQTAKLVAEMADAEGIVFLRTLRPNTPVIYDADEEFRIGGSRVLRSSDDDDITLVGSGVTVPEALKAADALQEDGITARVIDLYSIKPVDAESLLLAAGETQALITVEDHWAEGGIGETVAAVLAEAGAGTRLTRLAVSERPGSGPPVDLLAAAGIDAAHIVVAAERALEPVGS
jgi:transketolase